MKSTIPKDIFEELFIVAHIFYFHMHIETTNVWNLEGLKHLFRKGGKSG
jgi:hypothetical protein